MFALKTTLKFLALSTLFAGAAFAREMPREDQTEVVKLKRELPREDSTEVVK